METETSENKSTTEMLEICLTVQLSFKEMLNKKKSLIGVALLIIIETSKQEVMAPPFVFSPTFRLPWLLPKSEGPSHISELQWHSHRPVCAALTIWRVWQRLWVFSAKSLLLLIRYTYQAAHVQSALRRMIRSSLYLTSSLSASILKWVQDILTFSWHLHLKQMTREFGHCWSELLS